MEQEYIYAVARIKARELSLLTQQDLDRLMACKTPAECFRALADKGWGAGGETSAEAIFAAEEEKTWALMHELLPDLTPFSVLLYPIDFNNMKAAVKCTVTNAEPHNVFMSGGTVEPEKMQKAVRENDFSLLPDFMAEAVKKATDALLTTRDGQLRISRSLFCIRSACSITASSALKPVRRNTAGRCRSTAQDASTAPSWRLPATSRRSPASVRFSA